MRFRSLGLILALAAAPMAACSDATAPNPAMEVSLPPFPNATEYVYIGGYYQTVTTIVMKTPVGVDPVLDMTIVDVTPQSPNLKVVLRRTADPNQSCSSICDYTVWKIDLFLTAEKVGVADITLSLRANSKEKSSVRVISIDPNAGGKG